MNTNTVPAILPDDSPRARRTDPSTSHESADSNNVTGARLEVFALMSEPLADHELVAKHAEVQALVGEPVTYTPQRLRTARAELTESGLVEFTGMYRLTHTGRRAQVWAVSVV